MARNQIQRLAANLWVVLILVLAYGLARPWASQMNASFSADSSDGEPLSLHHSLSQGVIPGLGGGLQNLIADFVWLRMNQSWAVREVSETQNYIQLAITLDPRFFYFWRNGARILAYDLPVWRIRSREENGYSLPSREKEAIRKEQAEQAIALLERARLYHPDSPEVWIEIGQIQNNVLNDPLAAAASFLKAAEMENAPFFAGRLHAELLRRAGLSEKAYLYYRKIYPTLPQDQPEAAREVVLMRIRDLEEELEIPVQNQYPPEG